MCIYTCIIFEVISQDSGVRLGIKVLLKAVYLLLASVSSFTMFDLDFHLIKWDRNILISENCYEGLINL